MGRQQIKCHGDESRFEVLAKFIYEYYGASVKYIADVAGGQGLLTRLLNKKYNYRSEVIDPRGYVLKGIENRECEYVSDMAEYYDLIVGLHPDEAVRPVVESSLIKPVVVVPCCNHWDTANKLGTEELVLSIEAYMIQNNVKYEKVKFDFKGPKNIGLVTTKQEELS